MSTPVDEGARVETGDVIATLDDSDARQRVAESRASLTMAQARSRSLTELALTAAREELEQLRINQRQLERNVARQETLQAQGSVRLDVLEEARSQLSLNGSRIRLVQASLTSKEAGGAEASEAAAAVASARVALTGLERELEKYVIRAPFDGLVLERRAELGELVQPGKELLVLAADEKVHAEVDLDERVVGLIDAGQQARLWPEAFPSRAVGATVTSVGPRVNPETGTVRVRLTLDEPASFPIQDLTIRTEIRVRELERAMILERSFLWSEEPASALVSTGGEIEERSIAIEGVGVTEVLVLSGLAPGDIVVDPSGGLAPGDALALPDRRPDAARSQ